MNNGFMPLMGFPQADVNYQYSALSSAIANLFAGAQINQNDLVVLCQNGKAYAAKNADFVAVANSGSAIIAQTTVSATNVNSGSAGRRPILYQDNCILLSTAYSTSNYGLKLWKYSTAGAVIGSVALDTTTATNSFFNSRMTVLANGNIAVVWQTGQSFYYAVVDKNLSVIKAATAIATASIANDNHPGLVALSAGGFAVIFRQSSGEQVLMNTYDSFGTAVVSSFQITSYASSGTTIITAVELSNGDIAVAGNSNNNSVYAWYAVVRPSAGGSIVRAHTQFDATNYTGPAIVCALPGYFAIAYYNNSTFKVYVYNNAGTLQGAAGTFGSGVYPWASFDIFTDGINFYAAFIDSANVVKIGVVPTTGTNYSTITTTIPVVQSSYISYSYSGIDGVLLITQVPAGANSPVFSVLDKASGWMALKTNISIGTAPTTSSTSHNAVLLQDGAFAIVYTYSSPAATNFGVFKALDGSIMGIANNNSAPGNPVYIDVTQGVKQMNQLSGSVSKIFDHTASNIYGNKGSVVPGAVVLKGL